MTDSPTLAISRLTLTDFRNYARSAAVSPAQLVALTGANGAGKTNMLEAISLLAPGRGLRGAAFEELARQGGAGSWAIAAEIDTTHGPVSLGTGWSGQSEAGDGGGRLVVIDGEVQKGPGSWASTCAFSGSHPRRTGFSRGLLLTGAASLTAWWRPSTRSMARALVFEKVMRERNLLLDDMRPDAAWLASLEAQMAEAAVAISAARLTALDALRFHIGETRETSRFPWSEISHGQPRLLRRMGGRASHRARPHGHLRDAHGRGVHDRHIHDPDAHGTRAPRARHLGVCARSDPASRHRRRFPGSSWRSQPGCSR